MLIGLAAAATLGGAAAGDSDAVLALPQIDIVPAGDGLDISARVRGLDSGTVQAQMEILKSDGGGRVQTSQSREIAVTPGSDDVVASTRLSAQPGLRLTVTLTLSANGAAIGSARTVLGDGQD